MMTNDSPPPPPPPNDEAKGADIEQGLLEENEAPVGIAAVVGTTNKQNDDDDDWMTRDSGTMTLFTEVHDALNGAFLMFCLPDLKALATEGILKGDAGMIERISNPPVNLLEVVTIYQQNKELLTEERLGCGERADMYHAALNMERVSDDQVKQDERETVMKQIVLHVLDDVNEEEECVYAIGCNALTKRVTIAFRGSVTSKDFKQDAKALLTWIDNPIKKATKMVDTSDAEFNALSDQVGLHLGFKEYLYGTSNENKKEPNKTPKYKIILDQAAEILAANPGFELRIVGHSLGGALTTVLASEAAGDDRFPSPITAITSGAPKVGNLDFQTSFQYAEATGRIRCIQVANNKDPVTQSPPIGNFDPCAPIFCRNMKFRHVGLRLLLVPNGFVIWYPMKAKSCPGILFFDLQYVFTNCCIFLFGCILISCFCNVFAAILAVPLCCCGTYKFLKKSRQHHTQLKYIRRLEFCEDKLNELTLDKLNEDRFGRSVYAMSRVLVKHKTSTVFHESMFDSIKSVATNTGKDSNDKEEKEAPEDEKQGDNTGGTKKEESK